MELIIVESPTKARTLGRFLGKNYKVEATMGHIKDLPKSKLGVDIDKNFAPDFVLVPDREAELKKIKSLAKKAKTIYLATDPDREGEAIAAHVKEEIGSEKTKRIAFHEITESAVNHALETPRAVDKNLVDAQIARRVLDRLVGYKLSPLLWRKVRRGLSAGRVQTICVRLIVEREEEIKKHKKEEYWEIYCDVEKGATFRLKLAKIDGKLARVTNKKEADVVVKALNAGKFVVDSVTKNERKKNPYPPFTTSTMTQAGANLFGWQARKTMSVAQKLYEEGLITYHRTDSLNVAKSAQDAATKFIESEFGKEYLPEKPRFYKTKSKGAQEAHEAIRPTKPADPGAKLAGDQKKLYTLVRSRFLASQMATSVYDETKVEVVVGKYLLRSSGQIQKFAGWRKVFDYRSKTGEEAPLPELVKGDSLKLKKVDPEQKFTQPPPRYNEASLIKTLEKLGIGRPSTYAPTIYTIQVRKYIEKEDRQFVPTPVGQAVNDFLIKNFPDLFEYEFTAQMEDDLDKVAEGEKKWDKIITDFYKPFDKKLEVVGEKAKRVKIETEKLGRKCPDCKEGELVIRIGRFGKFVSCSRFPDCKHTEKYLEKIHMKCPKCKKGDVIIKKTGKGRAFFGCSRYPDCDFASWKNPKEEKEKKSEEKTN